MSGIRAAFVSSERSKNISSIRFVNPFKISFAFNIRLYVMESRGRVQRRFFTVAVFVVLLFHNPPIVLADRGMNGASNEFIDTVAAALTEEEKKWIAGHPTIRIAGPKAFPPFYFHDESDRELGIAVDYTYLILASLGFKLEFQRNLPWPQVLDRVKNKQVDLVALAAKTTERETFLNFSKAYLSFPLVIISRQDAPFIGGLNDLFGKKIACIKRNVTCEWLANDLTAFENIPVSSPLKGLEAVAYGDADVYIDNLASASYQIQKHGLSNLKIAAPTAYGNYDLFFAGRKDWPILISIINKSLNLVSPNQHANIRNKWLSVRYEHGIRQSDVLKWVTLVASALLLPIIIILIWNRKLNREVKKRERVSKALLESEKTFTTVFKNSPVPITISSLETDRYVDINDSVTSLTGYSREEILGKTAEELNLWIKPELRREMVDKVRKGAASHNTEFILRSKSGDLKSGLISGVKINLGKKSYLMCVSMDISERKKAEKKLRETEERYSALFERSLDPIVIYDVEGNIIDANPAALRIFQIDKEDLAKQNFGDFMSDQHYQEVLEQANEIVETGSQKDLKEYMLTRKDNSIAWIETTGSLIFENGSPVAIQGLGRDITQRKKAEKEQKHLISQLLDALDNIKSLKGMLPICANCKKIRDDGGYWNQIESYIEKHSDALFSHGICPDCASDLYGQEPWYKGNKKE